MGIFDKLYLFSDRVYSIFGFLVVILVKLNAYLVIKYIWSYLNYKILKASPSGPKIQIGETTNFEPLELFSGVSKKKSTGSVFFNDL